MKMQMLGPMRWHAVDLDGTLAKEGENKGAWSPYYIGEPIPAMVDRVKGWLKAGDSVSDLYRARRSGRPRPQDAGHAGDSGMVPKEHWATPRNYLREVYEV